MVHVLIVDDDESDRHLMRTMLSADGHEISFAMNGEQAMKLYLRRPIDVVVTDIEMPRGDGIELISGLKGIDPDARIVAVSGYGTDKLEAAREAGARSILAKPIEKSALSAAVADACRPGQPPNEPGSSA